RPDSARTALLQAHALWPTNVDNLLHLGRLFESWGELERAEQFYRQGAVAPTPTPNPNRPALRALYERTRGGLAGWEEYERAFEAADREMRRSAVLAERAAQPATVPPFTLEQMQGG